MTASTSQRDVVRRLAEIRARLSPDLTLQQFLRLLDSWFVSVPVPIGVLVGGRVIRGVLASRAEFSAHLDASVRDHLSKLLEVVDVEESSGDDVWVLYLRAASALFEGSPFSKTTGMRMERDRSTSRALQDAGVETNDWLPDVTTIENEDLVDGLVQLAAPRTGFALSDAELELPTGGWVRLGLVRVHVADIAAWWIMGAGDAEEELAEAEPSV